MAKTSKTDSFQLKADFLPITIMRMLRHETDCLQQQLENIVLKAPHYFTNAPLIIDFSEVPASDELNVKDICALLKQYQMLPLAARGLKTQDILPHLPESTRVNKQTAKEPEKIITKIISKPVRAGTQIYAKNSDLIVLASVNAGAEIIADGNIHSYAPLRGRALAGASGDTTARIFCKQLEAELVSIAGIYLTNEKIKSLGLSKNMMHIFLDGDQLKIEEV